ncbi:PriCT-2 domain-containing protein [Alcaligenaceae bacterium]|nr:PriCT-2 domain-containing protein [Alcaligenaceae bacterium]
MTTNPSTDLERARSALSHLDPNDRETWLRAAFAIKSEFGDAGFEMWDAWGALAENHSASAAKSTWKSSKVDGKVTIATLFYAAKQAGWKDDTRHHKPTPEELAERKKKAEQRAAQAAAEEAQMHASAAATAHQIWEAAEPAEDHPYLKRKGVKAYGLRVGKFTRIDQETGEVITVTDQGLLVPMRDRKRGLHSLQCIHPSSQRPKLYLQGGAKSGNFHGIGERPLVVDGYPVFILAEGYATAASVHEATGHLVLVCFDTSNLMSVARSVRERWESAIILMAADNDQQTDGNPGVTVANKVAGEVRGLVAVPSLSDSPEKNCDFNDLHQMEGVHAVRNAIDNALMGTSLASSASRLKNIPADPCKKPLNSGETPCVPFYKPTSIFADARDGTDRTRPLSDWGNALRMVDAHGNSIRYVENLGAWLIWHAGAWRWDADGARVRVAIGNLHKDIYMEGCVDADGRLFAKHARDIQSARGIDACIKLLSNQAAIRLPIESLDANDMVIGLDGARQVADLTTGSVRAALPTDYVTKSIHVTRVGDARLATRWLAFLEQIFNEDAELIDWIHRLSGYLLTGRTSEQFFVFFFGLGSNGKSVFAETLAEIMGDYFRPISQATLTDTRRSAGAASPDISDLIGARLAMAAETEDGQPLAESLVKAIVAGDTMTGRPLHRAPIAFRPCLKLFIVGNHRPVIKGTDNGIWRRVRLVPFTRQFGVDEQDPYLIDKLREEAPHIVAWMLAGCMEWQRRGLCDQPKVVAAQTSSYRAEQDIIGQWLEERADVAPTQETRSPEAYQAYCSWAHANGLKPISNVSLGRKLGERGFIRRKSHGKNIWVGFALKDLA